MKPLALRTPTAPGEPATPLLSSLALRRNRPPSCGCPSKTRTSPPCRRPCPPPDRCRNLLLRPRVPVAGASAHSEFPRVPTVCPTAFSSGGLRSGAAQRQAEARGQRSRGHAQRQVRAASGPHRPRPAPCAGILRHQRHLLLLHGLLSRSQLGAPATQHRCAASSHRCARWQVIDNPLLGTTLVAAVNVLATAVSCPVMTPTPSTGPEAGKQLLRWAITLPSPPPPPPFTLKVATVLMDSVGRRTLMIWSTLGMLVSECFRPLTCCRVH